MELSEGQADWLGLAAMVLSKDPYVIQWIQSYLEINSRWLLVEVKTPISKVVTIGPHLVILC